MLKTIERFLFYRITICEFRCTKLDAEKTRWIKMFNNSGFQNVAIFFNYVLSKLHSLLLMLALLSKAYYNVV